MLPQDNEYKTDKMIQCCPSTTAITKNVSANTNEIYNAATIQIIETFQPSGESRRRKCVSKRSRYS